MVTGVDSLVIAAQPLAFLKQWVAALKEVTSRFPNCLDGVSLPFFPPLESPEWCTWVMNWGNLH